ncbi:casein kinase 1 [Nematocida sp. AWRm77]|nr:casein kinase 1 [Nematocida sp. AWRm77]
MKSGYLVKKKIGGGAFGEIFEGEVKETREKVAIKVEKKVGALQLKQESYIYKLLQSNNNYVCKMHYSGTVKFSGAVKNILVLELLGPSLESLFNYCKREFSLKTVLMLAEMLITRLEYMHAKRVIHRDVKPENFAFGVSVGDGEIAEHLSRDAFYVLDFGLSCMYMTHTYNHVPMETGKKLVGTLRYVSVHTHQGLNQSRRDDLESLAYMLIYFMRGKLPWQNTKALSKEEKYIKIGQMKTGISIEEELCKGMDRCFAEFLKYTRALEYDETPRYMYIKKIFSDAMIRNNFVYDFDFDWYSRYAETKEPIKRNMKKEKSVVEGAEGV